MSKRTLYIAFLLLITAKGFAQYTTTSTIRVPNKIIVSELPIILHHDVQKGQTIYSIAKAYGVSVADLLKANGKIVPQLSIDEVLKIPISNDKISTSTEPAGIPLIYYIKPKDNLYRLSKTYFNQRNKDIMKRNNLINNNLTIGQELIIGWAMIEHSNATLNKPKEDFISTYDNQITNEKIDSELLILPKPAFNRFLIDSMQYNKNMKLVSEKEVAYWDKTLRNNGKIYVLHNTAIIGSHIEMYNQLLKRSTRAKVIGKIPFGAYTNDVKLILSPQAAKQLGGLNERFKVEITYYKQE